MRKCDLVRFDREIVSDLLEPGVDDWENVDRDWETGVIAFTIVQPDFSSI